MKTLSLLTFLVFGQVAPSSGGSITLGTPNGLSLSGSVLSLNAADGSNPGALTATTQTIGGNKTFTGSISASNISGTQTGSNTGDVTIGTANGLSLSGQILSLAAAASGVTGSVNSSAQTFDGVKTFSSAINSSVAANANAFTCANTSCRMTLGNTARYIYDNGGRFETNTDFIIDGDMLANNVRMNHFWPANGHVVVVTDDSGTNGIFYLGMRGQALASFDACNTTQPSQGGSGTLGAMNLDTTNNQLRVCNGTTWQPVTPVTNLIMLDTGSTVTATAGTVLAKWVQPGAFTVTGGSIWVTTAGTVGSTNAVFRISDGTNNCDVSFACNTAASVVNLNSTSGTCTFAAAATLTVSTNSIGNCTVGPVYETFTFYGRDN